MMQDDDDLRQRLAVGRRAFDGFARALIWCAWRAEPRVNKDGSTGWQKKPFVGTCPEIPARVDQPGLWLERSRAEDLADCFSEQGYRAGLGVLLGQPLPDGCTLGMADFDRCADDAAKSGFFDWARLAVDAFVRSSYVEASPSRTGAHAVFLLNEDDREWLHTIAPYLAKNGSKWFRPSATGDKAEAVELMRGGYSTVTGLWLPDSKPTIRRVDRDALGWLLSEFVPAFAGASAATPRKARAIIPASSPPQPAPVLPEATPRQVGAPQRNVPTIRFSTGRLCRFAFELLDSEFQLLAAFWAVGRRSSPGWMRAGLDRGRLVQLPGSDHGSCRSTATAWRAMKALAGKEFLRNAVAATPPTAKAQGLCAEFEIVAPLVHNASHAGPRADVRRVPRDEWRALVWGLAPFALRVGCWLLATRDPAATFNLAASEIARMFNATEPRAAGALVALVGPVLDEVEPPDAGRRRSGLYRLRPGLLVGPGVAGAA